MKLHIDIDCFFVSAHRIDNKKYQNIPIAVGNRSNLSIFDINSEKKDFSMIDGAFTSSIVSDNQNKSFEEYFIDKNKKMKGIITTSSYEARKYGIKTTMSVKEALRLCPHLIVLPPNYKLYHDISHKFKLLLEKEIPQIEQFSIDEFFCDLCGWVSDDDIYDFALRLKNKIFQELSLPVSIGISNSKWIAKLATEDAKPYGIRYIKDEDIYNYTKDKSISEFPGIGKAHQNRLKKYNISTLGQIRSNKKLFYSWGKFGIQLYNRVCGTDNEKILLNQDKKSIGLGRSFEPLYNREELKRRIIILSRHLCFIANKDNHSPLTYALQITYQYQNKNKSYINTNREFNELYLKQQMILLFDKIDTHPTHGVVQINLTLSNFKKSKHITMDILNYEEDNKMKKLSDSMHKLRDKFGIDIIKSAEEIKNNNR